MPSKEFVEKLVTYMKENRSQTLKQNCKDLGISAQTYYLICKKHGIEGKIGPKTSFFNEAKTLDLMKQKATNSSFLGDSSTLKCNSSQDDDQ